ncbi:MAG TPA: ABC transporter permease [Candidatus Krumholzibacteria bacterium]|nr:ABC transporter permease [Candidatus Krumholzibacteria bacterium]
MNVTAERPHDASPETRRWRVSRRRFFGHRAGVVGAVFVAMVVLGGLFAPWLSPYDPYVIAMDHALEPPSARHWLGTDAFGRDVLSRVMHGASFSLQVGVVSRVLALTLGTFLGLLAGYYGGRTDQVVMRLADVTLAYPGLLLLIAVVAAVGPSKVSLFVALGVVGWAGVARLVRSQVLSLKEREFVTAIRSLGAANSRVIVRHVFPNVLTPILVIFSMGLGASIMAESSLSFLGLGAQPPQPSWGSMISGGLDYLRVAPWLSLAPGIVVTLTVLGFNLVGDALRDLYDPKLGRTQRRVA